MRSAYAPPVDVVKRVNLRYIRIGGFPAEGALEKKGVPLHENSKRIQGILENMWWITLL
jgi:hypothetical protein